MDQNGQTCEYHRRFDSHEGPLPPQSPDNHGHVASRRVLWLAEAHIKRWRKVSKSTPFYPSGMSRRLSSTFLDHSGPRRHA